ncbi:ATP-binding cassette sub-family A member 17 [Nymphon striatum]|nr:ATP-binding cassette sub-family A member 17 [Nymphon striatum]
MDVKKPTSKQNSMVHFFIFLFFDYFSYIRRHVTLRPVRSASYFFLKATSSSWSTSVFWRVRSSCRTLGYRPSHTLVSMLWCPEEQNFIGRLHHGMFRMARSMRVYILLLLLYYCLFTLFFSCFLIILNVFKILCDIKDLSLNMYENQITCLLGHNGAGKTTTIAMLTALVNDFDIQTSISDVRKSLGFCPQHDILFDELTVEEHLQFYCTLKGYDESKIKIEISRMLKMLNLEDKREALSKTLSGGMKRKLSVGIALCANSKIVLLDEPTSGMDPAARRSTWDLLNQQKTNRTILLTTHYMEEADVLGDRIAILASGQLQCCGSSMFLKNKYGAGYHMTLVKEEDSCDINSVTELVNKFVPNAEIESNVGAELSFILPRESSPNFQALFQNIEDNKQTLGISGYGASITTMEEVFIKVGEASNNEKSSASNPDDQTNSSNQNYGSVESVVVMIIMALLVLKTLPKAEDLPSLTLDLNHFDSTKVPATDLSDKSIEITKMFNCYKNQFPSSSDNEFINVKADSVQNFNKYLSNKAKGDISTFSLHWIVGAIFSQIKTNETKITAFFDNQAYHSAPISLSLTIQKNSMIRGGATVAQQIMIGMAFLSASFVVFLVKEKAIRMKHLQVVSGVNLVTFWVTAFMWDFVNFIIPSIVMLLMFFVFNIEDYTGASVQGLGSTIAVRILQMPTIGLQDVANGLDWAFSLIPIYCLGQGTFEVNSHYQSIQECNQIFDIAAKIFSTTDRSEICKKAAERHMIIPCCPEACHGSNTLCSAYYGSYLSWELPGIGRYLVFLMIDCILFTILLVSIEKHYFRKLKYFLSSMKKTVRPRIYEDDSIIPQDDDVIKEKNRILETPLGDLQQSEMLIFRDLTKTYGNMTAVDHLSLGIRKQECFGLLGMNGAGKTSTFKMITGDENVSDGNAYLDGYDVKNKISQVQKRLGYCPQFDALIDEFTGAETLRLFARLKGVPEHFIDTVIKRLSENLTFESHLNKLVQDYSGGTKRKLSTAISLLGDSPIIFLDEPTAGVDPVARRFMWKAISDVKNDGRSVVLTSHSMEECEALCGRIVIMVNGKLCCLGSPQHLKSKFSEGYMVSVKIKSEND